MPETAFAQFLDNGTITLGKAAAAGTLNLGVGTGADSHKHRFK